MAATTKKSSFQEGVIAGLPFTVFVIPFATLFGVVATEAGLDLAQTMGFSLLVIAGASQFTAVQLMTENAPVWITLATALAVNHHCLLGDACNQRQTLGQIIRPLARGSLLLCARR